MKKLLSALITLTLCFSLAVPVFAADPVTPTPPSWMDPEDYLTFPGDPVYEPDAWAEIEALRAEAEVGALFDASKDEIRPKGSAGYCYELALIRLKEGANAYEQTGERKGFTYARQALSAAASARREETGEYDEPVRNAIQLWYQRALLLEHYPFSSRSNMGQELDNLFTCLNITTADLYNAPFMEIVTAEERAEVEQILASYYSRVELWLDGFQIRTTDVQPEIRNNRTMVPIRALAERLGATVEWVQESRQIVMTRAEHTVVMTLGQTTAVVDGVAMEMDVAPYATNGRTLIPARYMAEFFGQNVTWIPEERRVDITENKSVAGDSNLEAWAVPMGAILSQIHYNDVLVGYGRARGATDIRNEINVTQSMTPAQYARYLLDSWSINGRADLIETVCSMTFYGHNASFLEAAAIAEGLTDAEMESLIAQSSEVDAYMWPYTKQLSEKWGDRGILCWDLFRMSNLVQWGYTAGYLTYAESLALLEPAAAILQENFSSWDEAYENYLDGYHWWARENVLDTDVWETSRGQRYLRMKNGEDAAIFDDSLFHKEIIPVPGLTWTDLCGEINQ